MHEVISREDAKSSGLKFYFTNTPCSKGHIAERFVNDGKCRECNRLACLRRHQKNLEKDPERLAGLIAMRAELAIKREQKAKTSELYRQWGAARKNALANGDVTYQGRPCKKDGTTDRYSSGGGCVACAAVIAASDERKEYDKAYLAENKEKVLERTRIYRENNREALVAKSRQWALANPEKRRMISMNYKHRRRAIEADGMSTSELMAWAETQPKICYWCFRRCADAFHVDHYYPLSKGGEHEAHNLVIACPGCNLRKSAKDPIDFAQQNGRLL